MDKPTADCIQDLQESIGKLRGKHEEVNKDLAKLEDRFDELEERIKKLENLKADLKYVLG